MRMICIIVAASASCAWIRPPARAPQPPAPHLASTTTVSHCGLPIHIIENGKERALTSEEKSFRCDGRITVGGTTYRLFDERGPGLLYVPVQ